MQVIVLFPLSVGGIGLKDVSIVALLGLAGVNNTDALSSCLVGYPIILFLVLFGLLYKNIKFEYYKKIWQKINS